MNFKDLPEEKKEQLKIFFKDLFIVLGLVAAFYISALIFPAHKPDIYDNVMDLYNDGLFGTYFIIVSITFMYSIISMVIIHNRRVREKHNPKLLLYSNVISSIVFIYMIYLMSNLYYAFIIAVPFVISLLFMFYFNAKLQYYALKSGEINSDIEDIRDEFKK